LPISGGIFSGPFKDVSVLVPAAILVTFVVSHILVNSFGELIWDHISMISRFFPSEFTRIHQNSPELYIWDDEPHPQFLVPDVGHDAELLGKAQ
jgi:hypothetical protein